jgi:site-specific DNA recombinase
MTKTRRELAIQAAANGLLPKSQPIAIIYVRVSTKEQAEMGGDPEGFSIPAQREACMRKAESMGAIVAGEFVDRGESAKTTKRPELQRMLTYVQEHPVTYLIVHKVDRLARSRADDVSIGLELQAAGVQLVSCTESIDETPSGKLLHGIMASIAEFYSRNLAAEVMKGSIQKAKSGGTAGKAPLGYINVRELTNGRENRTVIVDSERAPLMKFAFDAYATGDYTLRTLLTELTKRGLTSRPGPRKASGPLALSQFCRIMRNPYYIGIVTYKGVEYPGKHQPIVDRQTYDRVQEILSSHDHAALKISKYPHYLKGTILCAECGARLSVSNNRGQSGIIYPNFFCLGRQRNPASCSQKVIAIAAAERAVEVHYRGLQMAPEMAESIRSYLKAELGTVEEEAGIERTFQQKRTMELKDQQRKLVQMSYADAIPFELLRSEQSRIAQELGQAEDRLKAIDIRFETIASNLDRALDMVTDCQRAYVTARNVQRRHYNQAMFDWIKIGRGGITESQLASPFRMLLSDDLANQRANSVLNGHGNDLGDSGDRLKATGTDGKPSFGQNKTTTTNGGGSSRTVALVGEGGLEPP